MKKVTLFLSVVGMSIMLLFIAAPTQYGQENVKPKTSKQTTSPVDPTGTQPTTAPTPIAEPTVIIQITPTSIPEPTAVPTQVIEPTQTPDSPGIGGVTSIFPVIFYPADTPTPTPTSVPVAPLSINEPPDKPTQDAPPVVKQIVSSPIGKVITPPFSMISHALPKEFYADERLSVPVSAGLIGLATVLFTIGMRLSRPNIFTKLKPVKQAATHQIFSRA